jgi:hypothetical protein
MLAAVALLGTGAAALPATTFASAADVGVDITDLDGTVTDQYSTVGGEGADKAADNAASTKYFTYNKSTWLKHTANVSSVVTSYTLTSANDGADRDPRDWVLEGSTDGTGWTMLDSRSGQTFDARFQRRTYPVANAASFLAFRLRITANNGSVGTQLAEWQLIGSSTSPAPSPAPPTGLTATALSGDQALVTWTDSDRWETSFRLERSTDGQTWDTVRTVAAGTTQVSDLGLTGGVTYHYRVRSGNATATSPASNTATTTTGSGDLPTTWQERWLEHNQLLTRKSYDADLAVYYDKDMPDQPWLHGYTAKLWRYTKQTYGGFSNPRLAAIFHKGRYGGGHHANVFLADYDHRNVIDMGADWAETDTQSRDIISHEMAHIVEHSAYGIYRSPSFALWRDSKWAEIYQYDAYVGTGLTADAERWYASKMQTRDSFPRANTAWFKDWFYPLWRDHGHGVVLARYFELLSANYRQINGTYSGDLNWGEFVHFWSGAAGVNLKAQATNAFGWPDEWERQFVQAQQDFPDVHYRA